MGGMILKWLSVFRCRTHTFFHHLQGGRGIPLAFDRRFFSHPIVLHLDWLVFHRFFSEEGYTFHNKALR